MKTLFDYSLQELKQALKLAKEGAKFDSVKDNVPDVARAWVSERIELVRKCLMPKTRPVVSGYWER